MVRPVTPAAPSVALGAERRLADAVEELGRLPVLSATVRRVQAIAESEDAGIGDMVAALEADQGLATDLLRYANSAACARPLRARSIRAAVTLVGRKAIAQLAIEAATFRFFQAAPGNGGRSIGHLHLHAAAVAASRSRSPSAPGRARHRPPRRPAARRLDRRGQLGPRSRVALGRALAPTRRCYEAKRSGRGRVVRY
jgi:hypothetical protein